MDCLGRSEILFPSMRSKKQNKVKSSPHSLDLDPLRKLNIINPSCRGWTRPNSVESFDYRDLHSGGVVIYRRLASQMTGRKTGDTVNAMVYHLFVFFQVQASQVMLIYKISNPRRDQLVYRALFIHRVH